jgi:hypothetical protein
VKLDKDLVREVLLKLEADDSDPMTLKDLDITEWPREQLAYTVCLLAEGGLIDAIDLSSFDGYDWRATRLTFTGHEYLETIRDSEVWRKTKEVANKTGVYSLQVLMEAGKMVVKQKLIEHGIHLP